MSMGIQEALVSEVEKSPRSFLTVLNYVNDFHNGVNKINDNLTDSFRALSNNIIKTSKESRGATQTQTEKGYSYSENKIPKLSDNASPEININPKHEKLLAKIFAKYNIKYRAESVDETKSRIVILSENIYTLQDAVKDYIREIDKLKSHEKSVDKDKYSYRNLKTAAKTKLKEGKELLKNNEIVKENKKDIDLSL